MHWGRRVVLAVALLSTLLALFVLLSFPGRWSSDTGEGDISPKPTTDR